MPAMSAPIGICHQCHSQTILKEEIKNQGLGIGLLIIGAAFAPFLFGIALIIWGVLTLKDKARSWHCRGCGNISPA
jgi:hypothetical protein